MGSASGKARSRGYRAERELVATLWKLGFAVMRAPASGAKIKRADYPDVVAIYKGRVAVFEVKARSRAGTIYIDEGQVRKLLTFAERAGGRAYIAVRLPHIGWRIIPASALERVKGGRYRLRKDIIEVGEGIAGVLKDLGIVKPLTQYLKSS
ncbi:MAG: Holliday junction resolvase [Thermoprotei archaeon]|nr:MAG: Holliday junction resolvase [Thermoprotei archaeon]